MEGERDREFERDGEREREREALWAGSGDGGVVDLLVLEKCLATSLDFGEELLAAGEPLWERERLCDLAGLRERLGDRDGERPRERERERDELSDLERLLDLQEITNVIYKCVLFKQGGGVSN